MMQWWRAHHGISNDSKLAVVAMRAKARKCEVGWVWVILIDYASQQEVRGSISGLDDDQISVMAEIPAETAASILESMRYRGLITPEGILTAWTKRQPIREREDVESSTDRVRKFRTMKHHETPRNAKKKHETPETAQIRLEEIRGEDKNQNLSPVGGEKSGRPLKLWYDSAHEAFYAAFWCHQKKTASRKAFERAVNRIHDRDKLGYNASVLFLSQMRSEDRGRFEGTKAWEWRVNLHPASWLNGELWTDEAGVEINKADPHQERNRQTVALLKVMNQI